MPRHSKNNSDGAHFTYAERATMATTVGSTQSRLGGDSLRPYHHCCLSLAPARDPVLTPGGYLYDKPAILAALLSQRRAARLARAAAATAAAVNVAAEAERDALSRGAAVAAFVETGMPVVAATAAASAGVAGAPSGGGSSGSGSGVGRAVAAGTARKEGLGPPPSNFWMPACAPVAAPAGAAATDPRTRCPVSGVPLRAKQLIAVRFTRPPEAIAADAAAAAAAAAATAATTATTTATPGAAPAAAAAAAAAPLSAAGRAAGSSSSAGGPAVATTATPPPSAADAAPLPPARPRPPPDGRVAVYVCAVCGDTLSNAASPTVLVPSGSVVCGECVRRFVVKTKTDPTTGERLRVPSGVVRIRTGGTAFAASGGEAKVASRYAPAARV